MPFLQGITQADQKLDWRDYSEGLRDPVSVGPCVQYRKLPMSMIPNVGFSFFETLKESTCSFRTWSVLLHRLPFTALDADFFKNAVRECALASDPGVNPQAYRDALPTTLGIVQAALE